MESWRCEEEELNREAERGIRSHELMEPGAEPRKSICIAAMLEYEMRMAPGKVFFGLCLARWHINR